MAAKLEGFSSHPFPSRLARPGFTHCQFRNGFLINRLLPALTFLFVAFGCYRIGAAQVAIQASISTNQNSPSSTVVSPVFSTSATDELLLALIATDDMGSPNTAVQSVTGAGLTWTLVERTNKEAGTAEIWRAFAPAALKNVSVTATLSQSVVSSITVLSFTGVFAAGTNGSGAIGAVASGYAAKGTPAARLVTTQPGSLVVGVGNDYDNAIARTPLASQTVVHQDLSPTGDTYWVQRLNAPVSAKGTSVTLGDSAPATDRYNLSICEVLPGVSTLTVSASSFNFGTVADGATATLPLTLKSTGTAPVTIKSDSITGIGFSISAPTLPATLSPGQSMTVQVSFHPTVASTASGTLSISSNSSSGSTSSLVSLSGTGVSSHPVLTLSNTSLSFGEDPVNTPATLSLTLSSTGNTAVTVSSASLAGAGFTYSGATFPVTLNPGLEVSVQVKFDPTAVGAASGTLAFKSNSTTGSTSVVNLSGTGMAAQHQVSLIWSAPPNSPVPVMEYNVYRATGSSSSRQLIDSTSSTSYVDLSVQANTVYTYYVTSVSAAGTQSSPSNQVTVTVP